MGGLNAWHWIVVALVILVLFGRGKISETMGDFGKGFRSFKKGLSEDDSPNAAPPPPPPAQIAATPPASEQAPAPAPKAETSGSD
jgi:sec-independent protein translocase protein TatA